MMKAASPESYSGKGVTQFQEALIEKRNLVMLERALPILETASAFVAVGALHLPGETGLVEQFRNQGFKVSPVQ